MSQVYFFNNYECQFLASAPPTLQPKPITTTAVPQANRNTVAPGRISNILRLPEMSPFILSGDVLKVCFLTGRLHISENSVLLLHHHYEL